MSLVLGKEEKIVRDESNVWYHNGSSRYGSPMWGRLLLTNKRFAFVEQGYVESGAFFNKKKELQTKGIKINLPIEKVVGSATETRTRKKGTLNQPAGMLGKESYNVVIISLDTDNGVDNPVFEVVDPSGWSTAIQQATGGQTV